MSIITPPTTTDTIFVQASNAVGSPVPTQVTQTIPSLVEGSNEFGLDTIIVWLIGGILLLISAYFKYILNDHTQKLNGLHRSVNEKLKKNHDDIEQVERDIKEVEKKQASALANITAQDKKFEARDKVLAEIKAEIKALTEKIDRLIERK